MYPAQESSLLDADKANAVAGDADGLAQGLVFPVGPLDSEVVPVAAGGVILLLELGLHGLQAAHLARVAGAAGREIEEPSPLLQVRTDAPASFVPEEVSEERGGFRGIVFTYIRQLELNGKGVVVFDRLNKDGDLGGDIVSECKTGNIRLARGWY